MPIPIISEIPAPTAEEQADAEIDLTWSIPRANGSPITGYKIERSTISAVAVAPYTSTTVRVAS